MSTLILFLPPVRPGPATEYSYTLTADGHTALRHATAPAALLPERRFLIGGNGWADRPMPQNVRAIGHGAQHRGAARAAPRMTSPGLMSRLIFSTSQGRTVKSSAGSKPMRSTES